MRYYSNRSHHLGSLVFYPLQNFYPLKKIIIFLSFIYSTPAFSQYSDLQNLVNGEQLRFDALYRGEELFGYYSLYYKGLTPEKLKNFEIVLLDEDLNEILKKNFEGEKVVADYYAFFDEDKNLVLNPIPDFNLQEVKNNSFFYPRKLMLNLVTGDIQKHYRICFESNKLMKCDDSKRSNIIDGERKLKQKIQGYYEESNVYTLEKKGFLVTTHHSYPKFNRNNKIIVFDNNENLKWEYKFNESGDKNLGQFFTFLHTDSSYIYGIMTNYIKTDLQCNFMVFDIATGDVVNKQNLEISNFYELSSIVATRIEGSYNTIDMIAKRDKLYFNMGVYSKIGQQKGYRRIAVDLNNQFKIESEGYSYVDLKSYLIDIDSKGKDSEGFSLSLRDVFFFKDGTQAMLFEKFKWYNNFWTGKYEPHISDVAVVLLDSDFTITAAKYYYKKVSKKTTTDYLFSQYLKDKEAAVFYYANYQNTENKEKNWVMQINHVQKGQVSQEELVISSKDFFIFPYLAKEGYILLREFNSKESHNQIRLEKLNF
jgi:hypothetical protein